jgi:hypothetical protein
MEKIELFNEEWRVIQGYPDYEVSDYGNVRSKDRIIRQFGHKGYYERLMKGRLLKLRKQNAGYLVVWLCKDGMSKIVTVHRLVACAFIGVSELDVNHKNGDKTDNRVDNLEYVDRSTNIKHSYNVLNQRDRINKSVVCVETGEKFNSIREAGKAKGVNPISIGHVLAGRNKTAGGLTWKKW